MVKPLFTSALETENTYMYISIRSVKRVKSMRNLHERHSYCLKFTIYNKTHITRNVNHRRWI